jgi:hypothetical protein
MATVQTRNPVAAAHPITGQFITLARGMEFPDDDPMVTAHAWAFEPDDAPRFAESVAIETATAEPGKRRYTRRTQPSE